MFYKKSSYNYYCYNGKNLLIYNTLNGTFSKILHNDISKLKPLKNSRFHVKSDELIEAGVIIPETTDENIQYNAYKHNLLKNNVLSIVIILTSNCNFRCKYCFESNYDFSPEDLSETSVNAIINYIRKNISNYSGLSISWFGGEPLLKLDLIKLMSDKFIHICDSAKKLYKASIVTNGYLLTKNVFTELLNYNVREYQITIDGLKSTHDKLKPLKNGMGTFDKIIYNLTNIKKCKGRFRISIRTNCNLDVVKNLEQYIRYIEEIFQLDPRFKIYFNPIYNAGGSFLNELSSTLISLDEYELSLKAFDILKNKSLFDENWFISRLSPNILCGSSILGNYVFSETGQVCKCSTHYQNDDLCIVGSINGDTVYIDKHKEAMWLYNLNDEKFCAKCKFKPVCYSTECPYYKLIKKQNNTICFKKSGNTLKLTKILRVMDELGIFKTIQFD